MGKAEVLVMGNQKDRGEKPLIVVSSVTYALKGRDVLFFARDQGVCGAFAAHAGKRVRLRAARAAAHR